ncbi:protein maelstrom 1-like [Panonychus citri]|uniref:protein maelstrom 1-like n=1 Tax=Panonychus citri TaxID=50023 RepID=UPI0023081F40|nr:protein maelstrom 1-like [Panonychus citri]
MGKIKSSAFWWFMHHLQEKEHRKSGRVPPMSQINVKAGDLWKKMSPEERQPFIDKHERYKSGSRPPLVDFSPSMRHRNEPNRRPVKEDPDTSRPESRSSTTSSSTLTEDQNRKKKITAALMKYIDETDIEKILKTKFYIIASNVMCATRKEIVVDGCITEDIYYPLEIGIAEFTIADGILYAFNQFIDPGPIPNNMARICHEHAKKHDIPLSDFGLFKGCCKDPLTQEYIPEQRKEEFDRVICDIHDMLVNSIIDEIQDTPEQPIKLLFCQADQTFQNKGVLKTLGKEAGYNDFADNIEVLDVLELFFFLCRRKGYKVKAFLLDILECSKFNYDGRCEYHSSTESSYCAITVAMKYCWLMFEKLSELYDFKLTEKHKPPEEKKKEIKTSEDWLTWETEPPPKSSTKRRYYCEDFDEPRRPTKVQHSVVWTETLGRGTSRHRDVHSANRSADSVVFASTDIRERNRDIKMEPETEPIAGPSHRVDVRPRLPGAQPVVSDPFKVYKPQKNLESKPRPVPPPTPETSRPLGRGRGRDPRPNN